MREYSSKNFLKDRKYLNSDLIDNSSCISDFLDFHFYGVATITIMFLFLYPKILNNFLPKKNLEVEQIHYNTYQSDLNYTNIHSGLSISDVDIKSQISVLKYFNFNFLEFMFERSDEVLLGSCQFITYSEPFFKFVKFFFSNQNVVNNFCSDLPLLLRNEYINFFENLKICNSIDDFNRICYKEEIVVEIIHFIRKTYKIL